MSAIIDCRNFWLLFGLAILLFAFEPTTADHVREIQAEAEENESANWGHWGNNANNYKQWTNHSNRLIPIYTFGIDLNEFKGNRSAYRNAAHLRSLYGQVPKGTLNRQAQYLDQTDVYRLQRQALVQGKKNIILFVFDGMDWQSTQAAAIYKTQKVSYKSGRGTGLLFQDYRGTKTDFGFFVSSAHNSGTKYDVNSQTISSPGGNKRGGYSAKFGGPFPWSKASNDDYLLGELRSLPHVVTDSASSATSMTSGIKTYNSAINVDPFGNQVIPIARALQAQRGFSVGVVTSVPISHATPACAYANNVNRNDYQDLTRDMLGLRSISHRIEPLPGLDVLLGAGWGESKDEDENQGRNFVPGNRYLTDIDLIEITDQEKYVVTTRTAKKNGKEVLMNAARLALQKQARLFGFFGAGGGNLPYQTADGKYDPVGKEYSAADVFENPTLADMTRAALGLLSQNEKGFWLMVEAGDVDWANHSNNIDNSIGATLSGDAAFKMAIDWVQKRNAWDETIIIVTADHGHYFVLDQPEALISRK